MQDIVPSKPNEQFPIIKKQSKNKSDKSGIRKIEERISGSIKGFGYFSLSIMILIGVVVIFVIWYAFTYLLIPEVGKEQLPSTIYNTTQTKTSTKETTIQDETKDWKTYTNKTKGISIKYPKYYVVREINKGKSFIFVKSSYSTDIGDLFIGIDESVGVSGGDDIKLSLDEIIQNRVKNTQFKKSARITLDDQPAYEGLSLGALRTYEIICKYNNHVFDLIFNTGDKDTFEQSKKALTDIQKNMLSTFKFTS